jgi:ribosomal protein L16/L10AE
MRTKQESARRISMRLQEKETSMWSRLFPIKFVSKESERLSESHCIDRCGKANVAQTVTNNKSEVWKRRVDRKQNSLHVAARAERPM